MENGRWLRRICGFLSARLPELGLIKVEDPRQRRGKRWRASQLLQTMLLGLMAGKKSLKEIEALSSEWSLASRKISGVARRVADTTLRDFLVMLDPSALRGILHRCNKAARKRKALEPEFFPFGVTAMDGKGTALPSWDDDYAQRIKHEETNAPYGHLRTITSTLISVAAKPCLDAHPIPASTNEMGAFGGAFDWLCRTYGDLFKLVSYDAGGVSKENADMVKAYGKEYFFRLKNENWHMRQFAEEMLNNKSHAAETRDVVDNHTLVIRRVFLYQVQPIAGRTLLAWSHTNTFMRVESVTEKDGKVVAKENRYWCSSLDISALSAEKWLLLARLHWGVEQTHNRLDVVFEEDDHPFITYDPKGALCVMLLRRVAYTLLALFRSVTLRSDENRNMPWKDLLRGICNALIAATDKHVCGLRQRVELEAAFV